MEEIKLKKLLLLGLLVGCADKIVLPDHKEQIDANTTQSEANKLLLESHALILEDHEARIKVLEEGLAELEKESNSHSEDLLSLFNSVANLEQADIDILDELHMLARESRRADRKLRRKLRNKFNRLSRQLSREIRDRQLADSNLQDQIDTLSDNLEDLDRREARSTRMLTFGILLTNARISSVQSSLISRINNLENDMNNSIADLRDDLDRLSNKVKRNKRKIKRLNILYSNLSNSLRRLSIAVRNNYNNINTIQNEVNSIENEITLLEQDMSDAQDDISTLFDLLDEQDSDYQIVDVVDPCGDGSGPDEVLVVLANGSVMAWYKNKGLALLDPGVRYRTTDKQKCRFEVTASGEVLDGSN